MIETWSHEDCLNTDPFSGDFGDDERMLSNKIIKHRKPFICHDCGQSAKVGTLSRAMTEVSRDGIVTFRWCESCCAAMAISGEDNGEAWEKRVAMRHQP